MTTRCWSLDLASTEALLLEIPPLRDFESVELQQGAIDPQWQIRVP